MNKVMDSDEVPLKNHCFYRRYSLLNGLYIKKVPTLYFELSLKPAGNYMFKVNNRNTRTRCEIFLKLSIKTPERRH